MASTRYALRPTLRQSSPRTKDSYTHPATPSAGRTGGVLTCLTKSPFKVRDNQRPERTMSGVRKPPPESSVPGENLTRGSRRNQLRRGHGSPPVLSEVPHELSTDAHSKECKRSPQQFIPAGFPLHDQPPWGAEDPEKPISPHRTRSVPVASSILNSIST